MDLAASSRMRLPLTAAVTVAYLSLLAWQHLHGGVPGHSFLARDEMPVISNWWGAIVLPVLTWALTGRVWARLDRAGADAVRADHERRVAALAFTGALLYGVIMAVGFSTGRTEVSSQLFRALPVLALLLPLFRAEYVLGFVLGLTVTFGAVLPLVIATAVAAVSALLHATVVRGVRALRDAYARRQGRSG
jgi:hypothetical protein